MLSKTLIVPIGWYAWMASFCSSVSKTSRSNSLSLAMVSSVGSRMTAPTKLRNWSMIINND